jgi:hypothetical protein
MSKQVLFLSHSPKVLSAAKKKARKGFLTFKKEAQRVSFNKGFHLTLSFDDEKALDTFSQAEISRLDYELTEAAQSKMNLVVEDFDLFFLYNKPALNLFLDKAKSLGVSVFATATALREDRAMLFDKVVVDPS